MKVTIVGAGYVGFSNAMMIALSHDVLLFDINTATVETINNGQSPIKDDLIEKWLEEKKNGKRNLSIRATSDPAEAYTNTDFIIVAVPTNYDEDKEYFDTSCVDYVLSEVIKYGNVAPVIIKSTIPIGYCESVREKYPDIVLLFSPEFLREGSGLFDCLTASRLIIGHDYRDVRQLDASHKAYTLLSPDKYDEEIREALQIDKLSYPPYTQVVNTYYKEAEAIKLFANTYLAMRVAFFNEVDNFAIANDLDMEDILQGLSLDKRIGYNYNNPSFGYGGYCLPKDTKQTVANFKNSGVPEKLMTAIVESNDLRKEYITKEIIREYNIRNGKNFICIYRLSMKSHSDNMRESAVIDIIEKLLDAGVEIKIYEPMLKHGAKFLGCEVNNNLEEVLANADLIVANRDDCDISSDYIEKLFTRGIYMVN